MRIMARRKMIENFNLNIEYRSVYEGLKSDTACGVSNDELLIDLINLNNNSKYQAK